MPAVLGSEPQNDTWGPSSAFEQLSVCWLKRLRPDPGGAEPRCETRFPTSTRCRDFRDRWPPLSLGPVFLEIAPLLIPERSVNSAGDDCNSGSPEAETPPNVSAVAWGHLAVTAIVDAEATAELKGTQSPLAL